MNERKGHSSVLWTASFRGWCRARQRELFSFVFSTVTSLLLRVSYVCMYVCIRVFPSVRDDLVRTKRREDALLLASLLICSRCSPLCEMRFWNRAPPIKIIRTCFSTERRPSPHELYLEFCWKFSPPRASLSPSFCYSFDWCLARNEMAPYRDRRARSTVSVSLVQYLRFPSRGEDFARARTRNTINPLTERGELTRINGRIFAKEQRDD